MTVRRSKVTDGGCHDRCGRPELDPTILESQEDSATADGAGGGPEETAAGETTALAHDDLAGGLDQNEWASEIRTGDS